MTRDGRWLLRVAVGVALAIAATVAPPATAALDAGPALSYFIGDGDRRTGYRPADRDLATWAFEAWARESQGALTLTPSPEPAARVRLYWAPLGESLFGEMKPLVVDGEPGAAVFVTAGIDALGPDIAARAGEDPLWRDTIVFLTCLHELGHAMGLPHTADDRDIMYSFGYGGDIVEYFARYRRKLKVRADMRTVSGMSAADVQRFRALHPAK
jgi:hypothetical protein